MADNSYKIRKGITLIPQTGDLTNTQNGDIFYNGTTNKFRKHENGTLSDLVSDATEHLANYIINGNFDIWQRGTSFTSIADDEYSADRFVYDKISTAVHDILQSSDVPTLVESGFESTYSLHLDCTTADATIAAGDRIQIRQAIEGFNFAPLIGQTFTLSFWVKATKTGTYCVSVNNAGFNRGYTAEYTINTTDTWEKKEITITHDATGTWATDNTVGAWIGWTIAAGSDYHAANETWENDVAFATSNQVNGADNAANDFRLAQVQIVKGDTALSFRRAGINIATEFDLCLRYYEIEGDFTFNTPVLGRHRNFDTTNPQNLVFHYSFKVPKRIAPTVVYRSDINDGASGNTTVSFFVDERSWADNPSVPAVGFLDVSAWDADAEL